MNQTFVFAVDPGPEQSALVVFDGLHIVDHATFDNGDLLSRFQTHIPASHHWLVIEQVASFGLPVGAEVFETVFVTGRFIQAWASQAMPWDRVKRHTVKTALCGNQRAKDPHIRQALLDRFGPGRAKAIGTVKAKGPLYGITGDQWSALAVAVGTASLERTCGMKRKSGKPRGTKKARPEPRARRTKWSASRRNTFKANGGLPESMEVAPEPVPIGEAMRRAVEELGDIAVDDESAPAHLREFGR